MSFCLFACPIFNLATNTHTAVYSIFFCLPIYFSLFFAPTLVSFFLSFLKHLHFAAETEIVAVLSNFYSCGACKYLFVLTFVLVYTLIGLKKIS